MYRTEIKLLFKKYSWVGLGWIVALMILDEFGFIGRSESQRSLEILLIGVGWMMLLNGAIVQSFKRGVEAALGGRNQETTGS
jgi:hypothetical protein